MRMDERHQAISYASEVFTKYVCRVRRCWPFVTGGSIDTLHYKLGVGDLKCED